MEREELLRISVGSLADWEHIKNDLRADALALFRDTLDSEDVQPSERAAVLADFNNVCPVIPLSLVFLNPSLLHQVLG